MQVVEDEQTDVPRDRGPGAEDGPEVEGYPRERDCGFHPYLSGGHRSPTVVWVWVCVEHPSLVRYHISPSTPPTSSLQGLKAAERDQMLENMTSMRYAPNTYVGNLDHHHITSSAGSTTFSAPALTRRRHYHHC